MFKDFSIFSCGGHLVYWSKTILAILVGSHLGNIPINDFSYSGREPARQHSYEV